MKYGARNKLVGRVTSIKSDEVMSQVKFEITTPAEMAAVITTESLVDLDLRKGDKVMLVVKAIHVLPVKE
jgi:molybdopterin-binding protein